MFSLVGHNYLLFLHIKKKKKNHSARFLYWVKIIYFPSINKNLYRRFPLLGHKYLLFQHLHKIFIVYFPCRLYTMRHMCISSVGMTLFTLRGLTEAKRAKYILCNSQHPLRRHQDHINTDINRKR